MNTELNPSKESIKAYFNDARKSVFLRTRINGSFVDFQTGIKCSTKEFKSNRKVKAEIKNQSSILAKCITDFRSTELVRIDFYRLKNNTDVITKEKLNCFFEIIEEFVNTYRMTFASEHLRNFIIVLGSLKNYHKKPRLSTELVTLQYVQQYTLYLINAGIENSTIKGYLKRIKRVLRYAVEQGYMQSSFNIDTFNLKEKQPFVVFLDKYEVENFAEVVVKSPGEQEVKNCFLFRCYTGIRFSEMPYIDLNNLDEGVLSFYIPKTSKSHQIPLNRKALELLKKVKRFNPISQQKENQYIKILAKRAKIERPVQRIKLSGSVSTVETFPKWKLCSSHTARRTWARIAYDAGVDILKISRYIGHSDIATTLKYKCGKLHRESESRQQVWSHSF